jgi:branched-chain amino acid transport system substrate-binding protein
MVRRGLFNIGMIVLVLTLVLIPLFSCAPAAPPAPPVTKPDKVVFHHFGDLSGPYAAITAPIVAGVNDLCGYYNTDKGGIDGVKVDQVFRDTGGKLDQALAAYSAFKETKPYPILVMLYGSAEGEALRDRFVEDKIACFTNSPSPTCMYPPGYEFSSIPSYTDSMGAFIDWVTSDWSKKTNAPVKLAILTWDSTFGRAVMVDEVRNYAKSKGVEIVYEGVYGMRDLDVSTQMTTIKEKGANWVYTNTLAHGPKVVLGAAEALKLLNHEVYDAKTGTLHVAGGPWAMDESVLLLCGPDLSKGMVGPRSFASWSETDNPGVKLVVSLADKNNRQAKERVMGYLGVIAGVNMCFDAIGKAAKAVGWDKLSGSAVRDQFLKMNNFDSMGITKYTYTATKPESTATRIFKAEGGKLLPITDWVNCPDLKPAKK